MVLEQEFRPQIKQTAIDKTMMVKIEEHVKCKDRVTASEQLIENLTAEL